MEPPFRSAAPTPIGIGPDAGERRRADRTLWASAAALYTSRRLIVLSTTAAAVASIVVALLVPRWYQAEARMVKPESTSLSLAGILGQVGGGLGALIGGPSGGYEQQLTIFTGRSYREQLIEELGLIERYDLADAEMPTEEALQMMKETLTFEVDLEFYFLTVQASDQDAAFAARFANRAVELLNDMSISLTARSARQTREYIGNRMAEAERALDSVRVELQGFQEENGVVALEEQAQAYLLSVAEQRGLLAQYRVQYRTLSQLYGPDNPQVIAAQRAYEAAQREIGSSMSGQDALFPIAFDDLPALSRRYVELKQEELIQATTLETIYPLHEQARFEEEKQADVLAVVDPAVAPALPARPSRKLIVILSTLTALLLSCTFVLVRAWIRREGPVWARRLQSELA